MFLQTFRPGNLVTGTIVDTVSVNTTGQSARAVIESLAIHPAHGFTCGVINTRSFDTPDLATGAVVNPVFIIPSDEPAGGVEKTVAVCPARQVTGTVVEPLRAGGGGKEEQGKEKEVLHGGGQVCGIKILPFLSQVTLFCLTAEVRRGNRRVAQSIFLGVTLRRTLRNSAVKKTWFAAHKTIYGRIYW